MSRFGNLFAPIRKGLLDRDDDRDPFDSLSLLDGDALPPGPPPVSLPRNPLRLRAPVGPAARNRVDDVKRVETAMDRAGFLGRTQGAGVFDSILDSGIRSFQRRNGLKEDGLLKPKGPTEQMLNRVAAKRAGEKEPDKDKDKKDCARLKAELANAEQAAKEARDRARKWDAEFNKWSKEAARLRTSLRNGLIQLGIEFAPNFLRIIGLLKRLLGKRPADAQTILNLVETAQKMFEAEEKVRDAQRARDIEEREVEKWNAAIERIRQKIKASGCRG